MGAQCCFAGYFSSRVKIGCLFSAFYLIVSLLTPLEFIIVIPDFVLVSFRLCLSSVLFVSLHTEDFPFLLRTVSKVFKCPLFCVACGYLG